MILGGNEDLKWYPMRNAQAITNALNGQIGMAAPSPPSHCSLTHNKESDFALPCSPSVILFCKLKTMVDRQGAKTSSLVNPNELFAL